MDIISLYNDYGVRYMTEGHKHCRPGWANTECPFCTGNPGYHLGVSLDGAFFRCWRCGWHPQSKALAKLLNVKEFEAKKILLDYKGIKSVSKPLSRKIRVKQYKLPTETKECKTTHCKYLTKRNFDPDIVIPKWNLLGTGPASLLDGINYSHRIIAPIRWNGEDVSFQGRDITNKHALKYMACPQDRELMDHKHTLYGKQEKWTDTGILVEGITDVWRLGHHAFACFGIEFKTKQVREIIKQFKRVFIVFDDEDQAQKQAKKMKAILEQFAIEAIIINIEGDPGAMSQSDANQLVKDLIK